MFCISVKTCFQLYSFNVVTARKRSFGQGNILHLFVILFTRGSASVHAGIPPHPTPRPGTPPGPDTPLTRHPQDQAPPRPGHPRPGTLRTWHTPPVQGMLGDTVNARAVRILLESCSRLQTVLAINVFGSNSITLSLPSECNLRSRWSLKPSNVICLTPRSFT